MMSVSEARRSRNRQLSPPATSPVTGHKGNPNPFCRYMLPNKWRFPSCCTFSLLNFKFSFHRIFKLCTPQHSLNVSPKARPSPGSLSPMRTADACVSPDPTVSVVLDIHCDENDSDLEWHSGKSVNSSCFLKNCMIICRNTNSPETSIFFLSQTTFVFNKHANIGH